MPDEAAVHIVLINTLGKSLNPIILLPAMDKELGRLGSLATSLGEGKLLIQSS